MIKGVLFDFDGTLTLPGALDFPAIKRELGCPLDQPILEYLDTLPPSRREELMEILGERERLAAEASRPNRGAEECLCILKKRGILLGIISRNSLKSVILALDHFCDVRIEDFTAVITREFSLPKPHPDGVYQAARKMALEPSELLVAGDFRFDIIAGKAAGARTVLLTNGGKPTMAAGDPDPDYVVHHLEELPEILELLSGQVVDSLIG